VRLELCILSPLFEKKSEAGKSGYTRVSIPFEVDLKEWEGRTRRQAGDGSDSNHDSQPTAQTPDPIQILIILRWFRHRLSLSTIASHHDGSPVHSCTIEDRAMGNRQLVQRRKRDYKIQPLSLNVDYNMQHTIQLNRTELPHKEKRSPRDELHKG
jgi:hypothetical protein